VEPALPDRREQGAGEGLLKRPNVDREPERRDPGDVGGQAGSDEELLRIEEEAGGLQGVRLTVEREGAAIAGGDLRPFRLEELRSPNVTAPRFPVKEIVSSSPAELVNRLWPWNESPSIRLVFITPFDSVM